MGGPQPGNHLQLHVDAEHERSEWFVQRVGWGSMLLLAIAALLGFLGKGPFSDAQAGKVGDDLYIEYDRFVRHEAPFSLRIYCKPNGSDHFTLSMDRGFLDRSEIKEIQPTPLTTTTAGSKCIFTFSSSGSTNQLVTFRLEANSFGKVENTVALNAKTKHKLEQFIWP
jgi:hypothetical protein